MPDILTASRRASLSHPMPRLILAGLVAVAGDTLFNERFLGISVAVFAILLVGLAVLSSRRRVGVRGAILSVSCLAAGLAPSVVEVTPLSIGFAIAGAALSVLAWTGGLSHGFRAAFAWGTDLLVAGPIRFPGDVLHDARTMASFRNSLRHRILLLGWIVPVALCGVFAALLASANPVIEAWLRDIPLTGGTPDLSVARVLLWGALLSVGWAFVGVRLRRRIAGASPWKSPPAAVGTATVAALVLDTRTVRRCLALFNVLFAVQTVLDVAYLWAGVALPAGMTYARYAHQGAYPLMVTALLAAAFTLVALRPGGEGERDGAVRALVGLWVIQNVLMVISAMLRLDLYVEAYSLTYPRVVAFVWMGLVAAGLCLILARIVTRRSNAWLVAANACVLVATLYACSFVSFPALVAGYNLDKDLARASHRWVDVGYAMTLGAEAIPAIDAYVADGTIKPPYQYLVWRTDLSDRQIARSSDWRAWTLRGQRLKEYLETNRITRLPSSPIMQDRSQQTGTTTP